MIQLKRTTSGEISGLDYGQLGVTYDSGVAKLYVGDSSNRPMEVTTNLPEPYNLDSIKPGTNSDGLFWSDNGDAGLPGTYRWSLYSSSQLDFHAILTRIYSGTDGTEMTGYFGSYVQLQNEDGTAFMSTNNGIQIGTQGKGVGIVAFSGQLDMQGNEVNITASNDGMSLVGATTMNIQSSSDMSISTTGNSSGITMTSTGTTALYNSDLFLKTSMIMMQSDADTITINAPTKTLMVNANSLQCSSQPMDDNDLVTKKYVNNLSFSPQASITIDLMAVIGFVRQLNEVLFSIPLDWQLSETSFYDCEFKSGNMEVMQGDASTDSTPTYIFGGRQGGQPVVGNVKVGNVYRGHNVLTIRMVKEDGSNFTKAHTGPCCIMLRNVTIAGTSQS